MVNVTFFGVRASAPDEEEEAASRYGRHGPCVALEVPEGDTVLLDLGTGVAAWAATVEPEVGRPVRRWALVTRAHPDHLTGASRFDGEVLGPPPGRGSDGTRWLVAEDEDLAVGDAKVAVRTVPHRDKVNGYRVEWQGVTVAYVGVHQPPPDLATVAPGVLEVADGADLLVHDAGRSAAEYALVVAREAGARRLALFGHPADRGDDHLDRMLAGARRAAARLGVDEVLAATEGTTVSFERGGR